jgi:predicted ArsR family transcriptional regulator
MPEPSEALDHPRREEIYEAVSRQPGMNWNQLQRETGLSVGVLMFHLDRLVDDGVLVKKDSARENEVLVFTHEHEDLWHDPSLRLLLGNESTRRVAEAVAEDPGRLAGDIGAELDLTPQGARYHLDKLMDEGLVEREEDGHNVRFGASPELSKRLKQLREVG